MLIFHTFASVSHHTREYHLIGQQIFYFLASNTMYSLFIFVWENIFSFGLEISRHCYFQSAPSCSNLAKKANYLLHCSYQDVNGFSFFICFHCLVLACTAHDKFTSLHGQSNTLTKNLQNCWWDEALSQASKQKK